MPRKSGTFWNRLEPRPRGRSVLRALAAEFRDPLWLLARQWQLGEFQGEDGGAPSRVDIEMETTMLDSWSAGNKSGGIDAGMSLEPHMMSEAYVPDLGMRVDIAQRFFDLLGDEFDPLPFLDGPRYRLQLEDVADPAGQRFTSFMASRSFDGFALYADIVAGNAIPAGDDTRVVAAAAALVPWVQATFGHLRLAAERADPPGWRPDRLEHRGQVRARDSTDTELTLAAFPNGADLHWHAFDVREKTIAPSGPARQTETLRVTPAHVRFRGMPNARFWDFEDGTVNLAAVEPDLRDLGTVALLEFALVHGVDWLYADLTQPVGSIRRIHRVVVRDVFGDDVLVESSQSVTEGGITAWGLFGLSRADAATADVPVREEGLLIPPSSGAAAQLGPVFEDVLFARDEVANLAWAVERATPNALGQAWPGPERDALTTAAPVQFDTSAELDYRIMSRVPSHWVPLLPARIDPGDGSSDGQIVFLVANAVRDASASVSPLGNVLRPDGLADDRAYAVCEEEVPRVGVSVVRHMARIRTSDGASLLWLARRRAAGGGETGSGIAFDQAHAVRDSTSES